MSFSLFGWIRRKAAEAVVSGCSDGLKALVPEGDDPPADLGELRRMLAEAAGAGAKALPAAAKDEADDEATPVRSNGRRK